MDVVEVTNNTCSCINKSNLLNIAPTKLDGCEPLKKLRIFALFNFSQKFIRRKIGRTLVIGIVIKKYVFVVVLIGSDILKKFIFLSKNSSF